MHELWQVVLLVLLPLAWGLAVEYAFERFRRRRGGSPRPEGDDSHDWII